ncbi:hypothetical protein JTB14_029021 [Gonioctena quinquepunctata]|nr:hypothetical protein JTB14_029021 [Gonioctena quinquepunctata]
MLPLLRNESICCVRFAQNINLSKKNWEKGSSVISYLLYGDSDNPVIPPGQAAGSPNVHTGKWFALVVNTGQSKNDIMHRNQNSYLFRSHLDEARERGGDHR